MNEWPKITKDTPVEVMRKTHQKIWQYVMDHDEKPDCLYISKCVACEYVFRSNKGCEQCPIEWPGSGNCFKPDGLYRQWLKFMSTEQYSRARQLARLIRDVKWKGENSV